jgi:hypothetical protein
LRIRSRWGARSVRFIGAIEAEQKEKGEVWVRNDRLLGVATRAHVHANVKSLRTLILVCLMKSRLSLRTTTSSKVRDFAFSIVAGRNRP